VPRMDVRRRMPENAQRRGLCVKVGAAKKSVSLVSLASVVSVLSPRAAGAKIKCVSFVSYVHGVSYIC
jgi:hypothetical protein